MGYAFWLVPIEDEREALELLMRHRPPGFDPRDYTPKSFAPFGPHVTLATFPETPPQGLLQQMFPRDMKLKPIDAYFSDLRVGRKYLGAITVDILKTEPLEKLRDYIERYMYKKHRIQTQSRSFPHSSLFYFDNRYTGEYQDFANHLLKTRRVTHPTRGQGIILNCSLDGASRSYSAMPCFLGSEVWLVDCTSQVADWKVMDKRSLLPGDVPPSPTRGRESAPNPHPQRGPSPGPDRHPRPQVDPSRPVVIRSSRDPSPHSPHHHSQGRPPPARLEDGRAVVPPSQPTPTSHDPSRQPHPPPSRVVPGRSAVIAPASAPAPPNPHPDRRAPASSADPRAQASSSSAHYPPHHVSHQDHNPFSRADYSRHEVRRSPSPPPRRDGSRTPDYGQIGVSTRQVQRYTEGGLVVTVVTREDYHVSERRPFPEPPRSAGYNPSYIG